MKDEEESNSQKVDIVLSKNKWLKCDEEYVGGITVVAPKVTQIISYL